MKLVRTFFILGLVIALAGCSQPVAMPPPPPRVTSLPVVEFRGDDAQLGTQHGQMLGPQVRMLQDKYLKVYLRTDQIHDAAIASARVFESQISPHHLAEIQALARASNVDVDSIMLANCFLDLQPMVACSTVTLPASASPDGVARFGRNLDFPGLEIADKSSELLIFHPKGRYAFAAVSWPSLIGVLSGMNEHGLAIANMEVSRPLRKPAAMPYMLLYRSVLENCRTVPEAISLLQATPRQTANNLMIMDATGDRAVIELTPEQVVVRRGQDGQALISTNHQRGQDTQTPGKCNRYDLLNTTSHELYGHIDEPELQKMLGAVALGNLTMQSMVFEPANRVIYLATGLNAATHPYERIDLKPYFQD